jgi:hypothetical protein
MTQYDTGSISQHTDCSCYRSQKEQNATCRDFLELTSMRKLLSLILQFSRGCYRYEGMKPLQPNKSVLIILHLILSQSKEWLATDIDDVLDIFITVNTTNNWL